MFMFFNENFMIFWMIFDFFYENFMFFSAHVALIKS